MELLNIASPENHEHEVTPELAEVVPEINKPEISISDIEGGLRIINDIINGEEDENISHKQGPTYH